MANTCSPGDLVRWYSSLQTYFPDLPIDPRTWGPRALKLLSTMAESGPAFRQAATHLLTDGIKIYVTREQRGVGAGWHEDFFGNRWISVDQSFGFSDSLIALGHETHHLQQDIRTRCSVEGEYSAWRYGYQLRTELAPILGDPHFSPDELALIAMPDNPSRQDLKAAQALMQKIAGPYYLIGKVPLQGRDWPTAVLGFFVKLFNSCSGRGKEL
jgi:hypothetical protein